MRVRVCGPGFFRAALSALNSQTKLRVGDTTRNQKSMVGKGEERRFRAEIRLGNSGVCVRARQFCIFNYWTEAGPGPVAGPVAGAGRLAAARRPVLGARCIPMIMS